MNLRMAIHKLDRGVKFVSVHQRDKRQYRRKRGHGEQQFDHGQVGMTREHAGLPLSGEAVEEQVQPEKEYSRPGLGVRAVDVRVELEVVGVGPEN